MGFYYYVYMAHPERFTNAGFEEYCRRFGLKVTLPEDFALSETDLLFSMVVDDERFTRGWKDTTFRVNLVLDPGAGARRPYHRKPTLRDKLRKTYPVRILEAIRDKPFVWRLCGSLYGQLDNLVCCLLGGYLVTACQGVMDAQEVERFYEDGPSMDREIHAILDELLQSAKAGRLSMKPESGE